MLQVQWFPPSGATPLSLDSDPYSIVDVTGLSSVLASPVNQKSSGQVGQTVSSVTVDGRTISMTVEIFVTSQAGLWAARTALSSPFVFVPPGSGKLPALGTLRFTRDSLPPLDILAMPTGTTPDIVFNTDTYGVATLDFWCPYPFFKDIADTTQVLQGAGGLQFSTSLNQVAHPFQMTSYNVTADIVNNGTVPAPPIFRIYGDCTTPRLTNQTTGAILELTGNIPAGSYIEVNTDYGAKSITLVDGSGNRSNAMGRLNLAVGGSVPDMFWSLQPLVNRVAFTAGSNVSGLAQVIFRQRYTGI